MAKKVRFNQMVIMCLKCNNPELDCTCPKTNPNNPGLLNVKTPTHKVTEEVKNWETDIDPEEFQKLLKNPALAKKKKLENQEKAKKIQNLEPPVESFVTKEFADKINKQNYQVMTKSIEKVIVDSNTMMSPPAGIRKKTHKTRTTNFNTPDEILEGPELVVNELGLIKLTLVTDEGNDELYIDHQRIVTMNVSGQTTYIKLDTEDDYYVKETPVEIAVIVREWKLLRRLSL